MMKNKSTLSIWKNNFDRFRIYLFVLKKCLFTTCKSWNVNFVYFYYDSMWLNLKKKVFSNGKKLKISSEVSPIDICLGCLCMWFWNWIFVFVTKDYYLIKLLIFHHYDCKQINAFVKSSKTLLDSFIKPNEQVVELVK